MALCVHHTKEVMTFHWNGGLAHPWEAISSLSGNESLNNVDAVTIPLHHSWTMIATCVYLSTSFHLSYMAKRIEYLLLQLTVAHLLPHGMALWTLTLTQQRVQWCSTAVTQVWSQRRG